MKLNKRLFWIVTATVFALIGLQGCLNSELDELEAHERQVIDNYLTENNISGDTKTQGGIYYIEDVAGTGITPAKDDYVFIDYAGRDLEFNNIVETTYDSLKDEWEAADYFDRYLYGPSKIKYGSNIPGLIEGLAMMKEGGKASMIFPSNKAFYDYKPLMYEIKLYKVVKDLRAYEDSTIQHYLRLEDFDDSTMIDSTLWYKEIFVPDPSDTVTVGPADTVYIRFTGKLLDGFYNPVQDNRVFDTNEDDSPVLKVLYQTSSMKILSGQMLGSPPGFRIVLSYLRKGVRATAVLRYDKAFGEKGIIDNQYKYTIIPVFQSVVYDIEVIDIVHPAAR